MSLNIDRVLSKTAKFVESGDYEAAKSALSQGLMQSPNNPRLQSASAYVTKQLGSNIEAKGISEISVSPPKAEIDDVEFLINSTQYLLAAKKCLELLEQFPQSHLLWNMLGIAQRERGYPLLARVSHTKAVEIDPNFGAGYTNLGNALKDLGIFAEAKKMHVRACDLMPADARTHNNLGGLFEHQGMYAEAQRAYLKAHKLDPKYAAAEYNLGCLNLRSKVFKKGWAQQEKRWLALSKNESFPIETSKPLWDGSFVDRLHVWAEQGIGDEIMFATCYPDLLNCCNKLTISASNRLIPLFNNSLPDEIEIVDRHAELLDDTFDYHAPALTAIGFVRQNIEDFKGGVDVLLTPNWQAVKKIREKIESVADGKQVIGLSWHSQNKKVGMKRSIPLVDLVSQIPEDCFLINLQYGDVSKEVEELETTLNRGIAQFDNIDNWSQLDLFAALIMSCDKVVSIDNSTVHFAGALGKECHVLLSYASDWRWGLPTDTKSYWYKSLNLHWQTSFDDWRPAFESLKKFL